jgi:hypothetical protein
MTTFTGELRASSAPFKFLDYFRPDDADRFDGRESAIQAVTAAVVRNRTSVVYGRSGCGKTSLILAGLFPELTRRGYRPIYVRMLTTPLDDCARAIAASLAADGIDPDSVGGNGWPAHASTANVHTLDPRDGASRVRLLLAAVCARQPVVLILDQFEEFFIRFRGLHDARSDFLKALGQLLGDASLDLRVLVSLRQDYLGELDELRDHLPSILDNEYRLRSLTAFGARQAIARQLVTAGVPYEQRFLTAVVDLLEDANYDPTILQIVCSEAYRRAKARDPEQIRLMARDLEAIGSLPALFRAYIAALEAELPPEQEFMARAVMNALITSERTKRAATPDDLMRSGFRVEAEELRVVLERLVAYRLVRSERRGSEKWYELIHDRLIAVVVDWLEVDETFRAFARARGLIEDAARGEVWRDVPDALLTPGQIQDVIGPQRGRLLLTPLEKELVFRSAVHRQTGESVRYWANRLGVDRTRPLLSDMMADVDPLVRAGAIAAARELPGLDLDDDCLRFALSDPDERVRKAAAESLAAIGGLSQMEALRSALSSRPTRDAAFEALVRFYRRGRPLTGIGFLHRRRIARRAEREAVREQPEAVQLAARRGGVRGARAGILWAFTIGIAAILVTAWVTGNTWTGVGGLGAMNFAAKLGVAFPMSLAVGWLVGSRLAAAAERQSLLGRSPSWFSLVMLRSRVLFMLPVAVGAAVLMVARMEQVLALLLFGVAGGLVFLVAASLVLLPVLAVLLELNRPAVAGEASDRRAWSWALLSSAGFPVLLFVLLAVLVFTVLRETSLSVGVLLVSALVSLLTFTASVALAPVPAQVTPRQRRISREAVVGAVVLNGICFIAFVGVDTVPIQSLRPNVDLTQPVVVDGSLGPGFPDADYHQLTTGDADSRQVVRVDLSGLLQAGVGLSLAGQPVVPTDSPRYLEVAAGSRWLTLRETSGGPEGVRRPYRLGFEPEVILPPDAVSALDRDWLLATAAFQIEKSGGGAIGSIAGTLPPGTWSTGDSVEVLFFRDNANVDFEPPITAQLLARPIAGLGDAQPTSLATDPDAGTAEPFEIALYFTHRVQSLAFPQASGAASRRMLRLPIGENGRWEAALQLRLERTDNGNPPEDADWREAGQHETTVVAGVRLVAGRSADARLAAAPSITGQSLLAIETLRSAERRAEAARGSGAALPGGSGSAAADAPVPPRRNADPRDPREVARREFSRAVRLAVQSGDPVANNSVCWRGALEGFARTVLPACSRAIELDPGNGDYYDSRGVARALSGNVAGAASDFRRYVGWVQGKRSSRTIAMRVQWIDQMEKNVNPFDDPKLIERLRGER